jgi:hypothetical protein
LLKQIDCERGRVQGIEVATGLIELSCQDNQKVSAQAIVCASRHGQHVGMDLGSKRVRLAIKPTLDRGQS